MQRAKTDRLRRRSARIAVGVLALMILACALPSPLLPAPSETPVAVTPSQTSWPTRTATLEPSSTPTWTGTEVIQATLTVLPDYMVDEQGVPMAYVPAGVFVMGSDRGQPDEQPIHSVYVDAFYIDKFEVTNRFYDACVEADVCQPVKKKSSATRSNYYDHRRYVRFPVIFVDWNMAQTYCEWRGARLPTEAEWEKAARGGMNVIFPWGGDPDCNLANFGGCLGDTSSATIFDLGQSRYGVYNMAGNVWEWVSDWYADDYYRPTHQDNPQGPNTGAERVLRGGSWKDNSAEMRSVNRESRPPSYANNTIGFRCARDVNP